MTTKSMCGRGLKIAAGVAVVFGALTVLSGGRALFGGIEARAAVGNAVPFVLWFNFVAGFVYVVAGIGLVLRRRWAFWLSLAILIVTVLIFAGFGIHILRGGAHEMRTICGFRNFPDTHFSNSRTRVSVNTGQRFR